jgi:Flp pilus assembly protein TadG
MKLRSDRRRQGHTIVEAAFVLMIAILITLAIYDYSRYFMLSQLVNNAAREGAREAVANTNTQNSAMIQATVIQYLAGANSQQNLKDSAGNAFSAADVVVMQVNPATGAAATPDSNWYDAQFGSSIMVQVTANFTPLFPTFGFLPKSVTVVGTAVMSSEAN